MMWIVLPLLLRRRTLIVLLVKRLGVGWGVPESTMRGIVCKVKNVRNCVVKGPAKL